MISLDTETCGYHSMPVLLQFAVDDQEPTLYELWKEPICSTLNLLEYIANHKGGVMGFNLVFDWFHLCKFYTILDLYVKRNFNGDRSTCNICPEDDIMGLLYCEKDARFGPCLKPVTVLDLFLYARKGKYQSTLDRKDIRIKKVPSELAYKLSEELNNRIHLNPLYFARRKKELDNPWQVYDILDEDKQRVVKGFKDIILKFSPSSALKAIVSDVFDIPVTKFKDIQVHEKLHPEEYGYAPFAEAVEDFYELKDNLEPDYSKPLYSNNYLPIRSWPGKIKYHIDHWHYNKEAREYAAKDVKYLQMLYDHFDRPDFGDDDSILACSVAAVRWKGYAIDVEKINSLLAKTENKIKSAPTAPSRVKKWIFQDLNDLEKASIGFSTKKVVLESMVKWRLGCDACQHEGCSKCYHPAAKKAKMVLEARAADKEKDILKKVLKAGRFHASFKVIGALSGRMSGDNDLNPQGIKSAKYFRECFELADRQDGYKLCGGDFEAFEVVIALSIYKDPKLEADLNTLGLCPDCLGSGQDKKTKETCKGCQGKGEVKKKIHGLFGETIYEMSYNDIVATKGTDDDLYKKSKSGVFSQMYFGNAHTLMDRLGIDEKQATAGEERWKTRYSGIGESQQRIVNMFCSMRQPDGIGTRVVWHEPADYIESLLGFRRYFTLENQICKTLFDLAEDPPKEWQNLKIRVRRRDKDQTACGALRSALFGCAFQIQGQNLRAAGNHEIQSTGAGITKATQVKVWGLQPSGVSEWIVQPMNIHDELMIPTKEGYEPKVESAVRESIERFKPIVPMLSIDWSNELQTWADK